MHRSPMSLTHLMHKMIHRQASSANDDQSRDYGDGGGKDVSFHTAEWHQARIASLTQEKPKYDDWLAKKKADEAKLNALGLEEERRAQEYRAQLDADRARLLSRGTNHKDMDKKKKKKKSSKDKGKGKDKDKDKESKKSKKEKKSSKRKRSDSSSDSSSSDERRGKSRSRSPIRLSEFMKSNI